MSSTAEFLTGRKRDAAIFMVSSNVLNSSSFLFSRGSRKQDDPKLFSYFLMYHCFIHSDRCFYGVVAISFPYDLGNSYSVLLQA
jgi:hypothetical protein